MIDPRFPSVWCGGEIAPLPALQFVAFVTSILVLAQMKNFFFNMFFNLKFVACNIAFVACDIACDIAFVACDIAFVANFEKP